MNGKKMSLNTERVVEKMGFRIKKARLRRNISAETLAGKSGISKGTLAVIEKESKFVSIGAYAAALQVLEMETISYQSSELVEGRIAIGRRNGGGTKESAEA